MVPVPSYDPVSVDLDERPRLDDGSEAHLRTDFGNQIREGNVIRSFWLLGLLNNAPYVVMLASAKNISEGGTALVFIANSFPSLCVKLSAPYWFDYVSYKARILAAALSMAIASAVTSYYYSLSERHDDPSHVHRYLYGELFGVALISLQCGLGEASLLALAGRHDRSPSDTNSHALNDHSSIGKCLGAFSSGTGFAGPCGFLYKATLTKLFKFSMPQTLASIFILALMYVSIFILAFGSDNPQDDAEVPSHVEVELLTSGESIDIAEARNLAGESDPINVRTELAYSPNQNEHKVDMHTMERLKFVIALWPYMVPLFTVYAAEYACQSGAWTSIGFPIEDVASRNEFYEEANWLYQIGVLLSRSSGSLFTVSMLGLWAMPTLQVLNLIFFCVTSAHRTGEFFYNRSLLLSTSFYTGLLGGAVYVHGYKRIVADFPNSAATELALASTSVAEGLGVLVANISGLFIQGCLYAANNLPGATAKCPF